MQTRVISAILSVCFVVGINGCGNVKVPEIRGPIFVVNPESRIPCRIDQDGLETCYSLQNPYFTGAVVLPKETRDEIFDILLTCGAGKQVKTESAQDAMSKNSVLSTLIE